MLLMMNDNKFVVDVHRLYYSTVDQFTYISIHTDV
jgi:hypothetical protein